MILLYYYYIYTIIIYDSVFILVKPKNKCGAGKMILLINLGMKGLNTPQQSFINETIV